MPNKIFEKCYYFFLLRMTQFAKKRKIFFSKILEILKILKISSDFWPFWLFFGQIRIFQKNLIRPLFTPYIPLTSCKKSEKTNYSIFIKISKTSFLGHFLALFRPFWGNTNFPEKSGSVSFLPLWSPNFMQNKLDKSMDPHKFFWKK